VYAVGDHVHVWSNSQAAWIEDGEVLEVASADMELDGYTVPGGSVKVAFSEGAHSKWILRPKLAIQLRKAPPLPETEPLLERLGSPPGGAAVCPLAGVSPASASTLSPAMSTGADTPGSRPSLSAGIERLCKNGCGMPVQPGLTKGMRPFDTCCKQCAVTNGKGGHSANCGGGRSKKSTKYLGVPDCRRWLEDVVKKPDKLKEHSDGIFLVAFRENGGSPAGSGESEETLLQHGHLNVAQVREAICNLLLKQFEVQLTMEEAAVKKWVATYDAAKKGAVNSAEFGTLCKAVLGHMLEKWFPAPLAVHTRHFVRKNPRPLASVYKLGKKLGEGGMGTVYLVEHLESGQQRVCKQIEKSLGMGDIQDILQEIENMAMLDHPSVCKVYEYFEDEVHVSQIMELCSGGELQGRIEAVFKHGAPRYSEDFIRHVMKQTLKAVAFMHGARFMHKDLKPQNIMMVDEASSTIKVIDFGISELFEPGAKSEEFGGSLLFMAPEVVVGAHDERVDVFSAGVVLYHLITGAYPFAAPWPYPGGAELWQQETARRLVEDPMLEHKALSDGSVSSECIDLLRRMLKKDPGERLDASACLGHMWFTMADSVPPTLSVGVTQCLNAYASVAPLKKAIFHLLAHEITVPALEELRAIFMHFDTQNVGTVRVERVLEVLLRSGMAPLRASIGAHAMDTSDNGTIEWTEFLAAALCVSTCRNKPLVHAAFAKFDSDQDGAISASDLLTVIAPGGSDSWKNHIDQEWTSVAKGEATCTMRDFEKYIGQDLKIIYGDSVCAV